MLHRIVKEESRDVSVKEDSARVILNFSVYGNSIRLTEIAAPYAGTAL